MIKASEKKYRRFRKEARQGNRYYYNETDILKNGAAAIDAVNAFLVKMGRNPLKSADNRIPTNWHRVLTDQKNGYLFTYPPQFDIKGLSDEQLERFWDTLGEDYKEIIQQLGRDASNTGRAWLHYRYEEETAPLEYWYVDALDAMPVYDESGLKPKLKYMIYPYDKFNESTGQYKTRYEVWSDSEVIYMEQAKSAIDIQEIEPECLPDGQWHREIHSYGEVPFIEFPNNSGRKSDLIMYKRLIDAVDKLVSGFANDIDDIQEIIWVIKNYAGEQSDYEYDDDGNQIEKEVDLLQRLKTKKYAHVDGDGGIDAVRGEVPYEARGRMLDILIDQLYKSAMAVNPNPDHAGNQSGVYIDFLYSLLELKAGLMETQFRPALTHFVKVVLRHLGLPEDQRIEQIWTRNKPRNDLETAQIITMTPDTVMSSETKTKVHPLVEDWQEEREKVKEEQKKKQDDVLDQWGQMHPDMTAAGERE
ncbi:MAG: phage portal protein [Oscillospiraceae bacterium]|nr:phage portal protein [Oscillospiraceae bacterium]